MPGPLLQTKRIKNFLVSLGIPRKCLSARTPYSRKLEGYGASLIDIFCTRQEDYKKVVDILIKHKKEIEDEGLNMTIFLSHGKILAIDGQEYEYESPPGVWILDLDKRKLEKSERDSMWWNNVKEWEETRPVGEFGEDYNLVCVDYEVTDILRDIGRGNELGEWQCLLVKPGNGYYKEVWGIKTNVPKSTSLAYLLYKER